MTPHAKQTARIIRARMSTTPDPDSIESRHVGTEHYTKLRMGEYTFTTSGWMEWEACNYINWCCYHTTEPKNPEIAGIADVQAYLAGNQEQKDAILCYYDLMLEGSGS